MEPVALILAALTTGLQATAGEAVKDAYTGLKMLLQRKFAGKPVAEMALTEHEKQPKMWKPQLTQELQETGADQDQDIIAAAQQLLQLAQFQVGDTGTTVITFHGPAQGTITGQGHTITQTFGDISSAK